MNDIERTKQRLIRAFTRAGFLVLKKFNNEIPHDKDHPSFVALQDAYLRIEMHAEKLGWLNTPKFPFDEKKFKRIRGVE